MACRLVPSVRVILAERNDSTTVGSIKIENLRLNGLVAPIKGSGLIIDTTLSQHRLIMEFDGILAMYSMGDVSAGNSCPVTLSG